MASRGDFTVTVRTTEVVAAVVPLQEHWLPLSNLDLLLPPLDVGVFFCYQKPINGGGGKCWTFASMVSALKKGMAQTLISYYPLAGEVVNNFLEEPELLCNNRGVEFIEAFANVELRELNLYNPDETVEGKLVPKKKHGVLSVQATELKCGGMVVGCTFDHRICDAYSANQFFVSWVEAAQSKPISLLPSFRRSLLNPRRPGSYHPSIDGMYVPISELPPLDLDDSDHLISRIYYVTAENLCNLQLLAVDGCVNKKRTKLESFSGFLWKMLAECADAGKRTCKMGIVVDGRTRLSSRDDNNGGRANLMAAYFGNVLSVPVAEKRGDELIEKPFSWVVDAVHECLECSATKEHFLDLIDWVEAHRPISAVVKVYCNKSDDGPAFVMSSGQWFPVSKVDFGWGKPIFGSYHFPWGGKCGYVMPMPGPRGNGDWVVYMHLFKGQLDFIENRAGHVFRPFSFDFIF